MKFLIYSAIVLGFLTSMIESSSACEKFAAVDNAQAKEAMALLANPDGDPFDKLSAFELLSCSDKPVVRAFALKTGLQGVTDEMVRGQILMGMLMQRQLIRMVMTKTGDLDQSALTLIEEHNGVIELQNKYQDEVKGCIGFWDDNGCTDNVSMKFRGTTLDFTYSQEALTGTFILGADNRLTGWIRVGGRSSEIPSEIVLID